MSRQRKGNTFIVTHISNWLFKANNTNKKKMVAMHSSSIENLYNEWSIKSLNPWFTHWNSWKWQTNLRNSCWKSAFYYFVCSLTYRSLDFDYFLQSGEEMFVSNERKKWEFSFQYRSDFFSTSDRYWGFWFEIWNYGLNFYLK